MINEFGATSMYLYDCIEDLKETKEYRMINSNISEKKNLISTRRSCGHGALDPCVSDLYLFLL